MGYDANVGLTLTHRAGTRRATVILYYGSALRRCYVPLLSTSIPGDVRYTRGYFRNCGFTVKKKKRPVYPIEKIIFLKFEKDLLFSTRDRLLLNEIIFSEFSQNCSVLRGINTTIDDARADLPALRKRIRFPLRKRARHEAIVMARRHFRVSNRCLVRTLAQDDSIPAYKKEAHSGTRYGD